jgi:hypothetical protein
VAARRRSAGTPRISGRWIHLYEEDSARGAVYVPEATDVPLSRRPREVLDFGADGRAREFRPSGDDRLVPDTVTWVLDGTDLRLASPDGATRHARLESPTRLVLLS